MSLFIPRRREFLEKPTAPEAVDYGNDLLGEQASFFAFSDESLYDSAAEATGTITVDGSVNSAGLVCDGVSHAGTGGGRALFTGSQLTAIAQVEITAFNSIWTTPVGTDGNFLRMQMHVNTNGNVTVRSYIYIANAWRSILEISAGGCAVGDVITVALTFDEPDTYNYIAKNHEPFNKSALKSYGAPLDDEGGEYVFGAETLADVNPADCVIKNFFCVNRAFTDEDLEQYKASPYQIIQPRRSHELMPAANDSGTSNLLADDAESTSEATSPVLGQTHNLTADNAESASETTTPALGQVHALSADDAESSSEVTQPALGQVYALSADDAQSSSEATSPVLGQAHNVFADSAESQSEAGSPALGQVHTLQADSAESTSEATSPVLTAVPAGAVALFADDAESSSEATSPALGQIHALSADGVESNSEAGTPALGVVVNLFADDAESASEATSPALAMGATALTADDVESASEATAPVLAQVHVLYADSAESAAEVGVPSLGGADLFVGGSPLTLALDYSKLDIGQRQFY